MATRLAFALGVLSILAIGISGLALNDIGHGDGGPAEWRALQVSFALIVLFQVTALTMLLRMIRDRRA